jgi:hypothetical protein
MTPSTRVVDWNERKRPIGGGMGHGQCLDHEVVFLFTLYMICKDSLVLGALNLRLVNLKRNIVVLAGAKTQTGQTALKKDPVLSKLD